MQENIEWLLYSTGQHSIINLLLEIVIKVGNMSFTSVSILISKNANILRVLEGCGLLLVVVSWTSLKAPLLLTSIALHREREDSLTSNWSWRSALIRTGQESEWLC